MTTNVMKIALVYTALAMSGASSAKNRATPISAAQVARVYQCQLRTA
jgi:hypothetical protein